MLVRASVRGARAASAMLQGLIIELLERRVVDAESIRRLLEDLESSEEPTNSKYKAIFIQRMRETVLSTYAVNDIDNEQGQSCSG
jgi:hypothetical protein